MWNAPFRSQLRASLKQFMEMEAIFSRVARVFEVTLQGISWRKSAGSVTALRIAIGQVVT